MSHSPLPFAKGDKYASWSTEIVDKDGRAVAVVWTHGVNQPHKPDEKGLANLDLIVKAVNNHAKLVDTLELAAMWLDELCGLISKWKLQSALDWVEANADSVDTTIKSMVKEATSAPNPASPTV